MSRSILIVDDDVGILASLAHALAGDGSEVRTAESAESALAALATAPADLVLADVHMPGMDGVELLRLLRARVPGTAVVIMTAFDQLPLVAEAMRDGAADFLVKPLDLHRLRAVVARVLEDRSTAPSRPAAAAAPAAEVASAAGGLIGRDPAMVEIFKLVGQAAAARAHVLIRGASGTGKELVARHIHQGSERSAEPFVAVNCTALPSTLLESELFGHVRGAFTGAAGDRKGRFALAGRGSIFLDEIGDTSPDFQTKLLRVLQEQEFYAVGADRPQRTEARVIAATHRDLEALVADGSFREDLYYRLRIIEITLPPLRERRTDIPLLAQHLLASACAEAGVPLKRLSDDALHALLEHDWPGNVRELQNSLTRAMVASAGDVIRATHLELRRPRGTAPIAAPTDTSATDGPLTLDAVEGAHVAHVLQLTGGHKTRAADLLGVSRPRLDRLIRKHGLTVDVRVLP